MQPTWQQALATQSVLASCAWRSLLQQVLGSLLWGILSQLIGSLLAINPDAISADPQLKSVQPCRGPLLSVARLLGLKDEPPALLPA